MAGKLRQGSKPKFSYPRTSAELEALLNSIPTANLEEILEMLKLTHKAYYSGDKSLLNRRLWNATLDEYKKRGTRTPA